jgi:hypothetical protein
VPTSYQYRLLKGASWGIAIDVRGESLPGTALPLGAVKVAEGLWLNVDVGWRLTEEQLSFLVLRLHLVAMDIRRQRRNTSAVLVHLTGLEFNPSDYQPEGLAAAIAEWAAQEFDFPKPEIPVTFDRTRNRYGFTLERGEQDRPAASVGGGKKANPA